MLDTSQNSSFSSQVPGLQLAVDSTSLGEFKTCPRKYYYTIILGYQPRGLSIHLEFGLLVHQGVETYHKTRATGSSHQEALRASLRTVLVSSWDYDLGRAKPMLDSQKNRVSLVRALVWFLDQEDSAGNDPLRTKILSSGAAAVELSFRIDSGYTSQSGEQFVLCGHLDRLVDFNGQPYIEDVKTTSHGLDARWLSQFSPDNQFSLYVFAGQVVWHEPIAGLIVSGLQIGVNFVRSHRALVPRPQTVIEEWYESLGWWLHQMEHSALTGHWPQNEKSCGQYGGCPFRPICSRPPNARQAWLNSDFTKRVWDPLQAR